MSKLIISGKKSYTKRMFNHLKKEHPSTRHRMIIRDRIGNVECNPKDINYCELCGRKMKLIHRDVRSTNVCKSCMKGQLSGIKRKSRSRSIEDEWSI
jgi:hypothetical protein